MVTGNLDLGIIFLAQTGIGIFGNSFLLCFYTFCLLTGYKLRHTDLILNQLVLANSLVLFSKGISQTMVAFGWKYFLDDVGCKLVFYFHRVGTGVSFSAVCLLNGFQAIKLNPSICRCMELKIQSLRFIGFCCFLCWIQNLSINSCVVVIVNGPLTCKNITVRTNCGHCSWTMAERYGSLYTLLYFSLDFVSMGFMTWASGSMVLALRRHRQRVQHIRSRSLSHRPSHEARATHAILVLVSSFVTFYLFYTILTTWTTLVSNRGQWIVNSSVLVASCFPAFSPFVLILSDSRISVLHCLQGEDNLFFPSSSSCGPQEGKAHLCCSSLGLSASSKGGGETQTRSQDIHKIPYHSAKPYIRALLTQPCSECATYGFTWHPEPNLPGHHEGADLALLHIISDRQEHVQGEGGTAASCGDKATSEHSSYHEAYGSAHSELNAARPLEIPDL
ncbi:LOW QUALITY PROTEIN: vomeronasal type-1 receptor 1-like [Erethizon dorsatum]